MARTSIFTGREGLVCYFRRRHRRTRAYTDQDFHVLRCLWTVRDAVDKIGVGFALALLGGFASVLYSTLFMLLLGLIAFVGAFRWVEIIMENRIFVAQGPTEGGSNRSDVPLALWFILYLSQLVALLGSGAFLRKSNNGYGADLYMLSISKLCTDTCKSRMKESILAIFIIFGASSLIRFAILLYDYPYDRVRELSPIVSSSFDSKSSGETRQFCRLLYRVAGAMDVLVLLIVGGNFGMYMTARSFWVCISIVILENIAGSINILWVPKLELEANRGPIYSRDRTIVACMLRTLVQLPLVIQLRMLYIGGMKELVEASDLVGSGCDGPCETQLLLLIHLLCILSTVQVCLSIGGGVSCIYYKLQKEQTRGDDDDV